MQKAMAFMVHNLGLGDVMCFAPLFLLAMKQGYKVDIVFTSGSPQKVAQLIFAREMKKGDLRLIPPKQVLAEKTRYDIAVVGDRRSLGTIMKMGKDRLGMVLPQPFHARRKNEILLYNWGARPLLRLSGIRSRHMVPNQGEAVGASVFGLFCDAIKEKGSYPDQAREVRERMRSSLKAGKGKSGKTILVHLFRDLDYKKIENAKLDIIAECLSKQFPDYRVITLLDAKSQWEKEHAEHFSASCTSHGMRCSLLSPSLEEAGRLACSASLYLGVDHGISHLASMFCARSIVVYGGSARQMGVHALWPPQITGKRTEISKNISRIQGEGRTAVLLHPSDDEYFSNPKNDSVLINRIITRESVETALGLAR